ncbi:unnamed protein product, partial [Rotaria sp. Silwood1]
CLTMHEPSNAIPLKVDTEGKIKFDTILKHNIKGNKIVYSNFVDLLLKKLREDDPKNKKKTREILEALVSSKISAAMPVQHAEKQAPVQYIRYTPSQQGPAFNSGAKQRIIQMVEVQKDPMEPPRF